MNRTSDNWKFEIQTFLCPVCQTGCPVTGGSLYIHIYIYIYIYIIYDPKFPKQPSFIVPISDIEVGKKTVLARAASEGEKGTKGG